MKIVCTLGYALNRVPVNVVVYQLMMYSNVIVGITISSGSFVFSQSHVKVYQYSLANIARKPGSQSFDLVDCSLSVVRVVSVFHVGQ